MLESYLLTGPGEEDERSVLETNPYTIPKSEAPAPTAEEAARPDHRARYARGDVSRVSWTPGPSMISDQTAVPVASSDPGWVDRIQDPANAIRMA